MGHGQNPIDSARQLFNEHIQARNAGDFHRGANLLEQIFNIEYSLSEYQLALVHNNLGYLYYEIGRLADALQQYRMAEELVSNADSTALPVRISIHINLGVYYNGIGDYTNALEQNSEAVRMLNLIPDWDELSINKLSTLLLNKGITLYLMGRYEEALEVLLECEKVKKANKHPYLGSVYFNLARVYHSLGNAELCKQYYMLSIEQWSSEYDPDYYELANIYLHYGEFLTARGEPEQGYEYLQKALRNYQGNYGNKHPLTASCFESLARHSLDRSEYDEALLHLQQALQSISGNYKEMDPLSNPQLDPSRHSLILLKILATKTEVLEKTAASTARADESVRYLEAALASNHLSRAALEQIRHTYLSAESRIYLNSRQKDLFTTGIRLNLDLHKQTGLTRYNEEAFLTAARGKSGELIFEMNNKEWLYLESLTDTTAIITTELKQQVDQLSNLIRTETLKMSPDSSRLANWQDQLFHTRDSFNRQMEELRRDLPQLLHFESARMDFTIEQIRRKLKRKETLVEYFLSGTDATGREELFIFVLTNKECHVGRSTVDATFHQHLETITQNLHEFVPYLESRERFDSLRLALYGVYRTTVLPVESLFRGKDLIIVPDEMLSYIPFDALITRINSDSIGNYAGAPYLLHKYDISYMYTSQLISHQHPRAWRFPAVTAWLPENSTAPGSFGNLEGAVQEVQDILDLVKGRSIQETPAKQDLIKILQEPSILHLAMHSLATENSGTSPYFILDSKPDSLLSNQMHDYEINALHLASPMVVLSSCQTAGGQLYGGEGIMSLSRSFLQAGAPSVVHSLWPVEDAKSREIMVGFYGELKKGHGKSTALSRVKRQYLDQQPPFYTHPYYWAAFQITGDPSPVHSKRNCALLAGSILLAFLVFCYLRRRNLFRRV